MNILLTSAGRRSYMVNYFKKALSNKGRVHASNSEWSIALKAANNSLITPLIYDSKYISFLLKYCIKNKISAIIPLFDVDIPILSKSRELFEEKGIKVIVADYKTTQICNDKWKTYLFLKSIGLGTPASYLSLKDALKALKSREIRYPVMIKPRWGMGSIAIYSAQNDEELKILYNKTKDIIFDSYLKYESRSDPDNSIIIQEKIEGIEMGFDILKDLKGNLLTYVPKLKLSMRAGETDSAKIVSKNADLDMLVNKLSNSLSFIGNLDVDCFKTKKGYYTLDMNCRFGGQYPFSHLAGVNFPKAIVQMLKNIPIRKRLLKFKKNIIGVKDIQPITIKK